MFAQLDKVPLAAAANSILILVECLGILVDARVCQVRIEILKVSTRGVAVVLFGSKSSKTLGSQDHGWRQ